MAAGCFQSILVYHKHVPQTNKDKDFANKVGLLGNVRSDKRRLFDMIPQT